MPKIITDDQGRLALPDDFVRRRRLVANLEYWLDEREDVGHVGTAPHALR
jgi:hypothetical protein